MTLIGIDLIQELFIINEITCKISVNIYNMRKHELTRLNRYLGLFIYSFTSREFSENLENSHNTSRMNY